MAFKQKGFPMHSSKSALKQASPLKNPPWDDHAHDNLGMHPTPSSGGGTNSPGTLVCEEWGQIFEKSATGQSELDAHYLSAHNSGGTTNYIYGCMDSNASNFNPNATAPDGSCVYEAKPTKTKVSTNISNKEKPTKKSSFKQENMWPTTGAEGGGGGGKVDYSTWSEAEKIALGYYKPGGPATTKERLEHKMKNAPKLDDRG